MPVENSKNFMDQLVENDMARLKSEVERIKNLPEAAKMTPPEIVKESLKIWSEPNETNPEKSGKSPEILPSYLEKEPADVKLYVEQLIDLGLHEGMEKAFKTAKKTSPFIFDAFHDAVVGKIYPNI